MATVCVLMGALALAGSSSAAAPVIVAPTVSAATWTSANAPSASAAFSNSLAGVACASASFCVAVGQQASGSGNTIEQWNGTSWSVAPGVTLTGSGVLNGVSCVGPLFCVAVGAANAGGTLIEQWNGTTWAQVTSPNPTGSSDSALESVSCLSSTQCQAVGFTHPATGIVALAEEWNGTSWTVVTTPDPAGSNDTQFEGIDCTSASFCNAVGEAVQGSSSVTLAEEWNGTAWTIVTTPNPAVAANSDDLLYSVSCDGPSFCDAVGGAYSGSASNATLIETWNGSTWAIVSSPDTSSTEANYLKGVDCISQTSCSAVGYADTSTPGENSLAMTWNGTAWTIVTTPDGTTSAYTSLAAVTCITDWECVAAGSVNFSANEQPFIISAPIARSGYRFVASDGGVFAEGAGAPFLGSLGGVTLNAPIVGMGVMPAGDGYYLVGADGGVFTFGSAQFYGSTGGIHLNKPIVGMAVTPDGGGYWLVASDGGVFSFGDAQFYGSTGNITLNKPIVGMAATPDGHGYWLVASDGGVFSFGDATFQGSTGTITLTKPVVGRAATTGGGYYLVASDGGIFTFPTIGGPPFSGSTGNIVLNKPIIGMTTVSGGYYLGAADGGIFTFPNSGGPPFLGSEGGTVLNAPIVGLAS
jgi:hypothetical protein